MQGDEEEEETDNLVNQVLDEIGINLDEQMVAAPGQKAQVSIWHAWLCPGAMKFIFVLIVVAIYSPSRPGCKEMHDQSGVARAGCACLLFKRCRRIFLYRVCLQPLVDTALHIVMMM